MNTRQKVGIYLGIKPGEEIDFGSLIVPPSVELKAAKRRIIK